MMSKPQFQIYSLNVRGLNTPYKRHALFRDLHKSQPAIVCLQETHFCTRRPPSLKSRMYTEAYHSTAQTKSRGVSILFHKDWTFVCSAQYVDPLGRLVILVGTLNELPITIANLYLPNKNKISYLQKAYGRVKKISSGTLFLCGDFNCTPDPDVDTQSSHPSSKPRSPPASSKQLREFMHSFELYDTWRICHPTTRDYTFFSHVHSSYSRIDLCLIHSSALSRLLEATIGIITWSDHAPLTLTFEAAFPPRGMGNWRLNDSLIVNEDDVANTRQLLQEYFTTNITEDVATSSVWLAHKAVLRGHFIQKGAQKKRRFNAQTSALLRRITELESQNKTAPAPHITAQLTLQRRELEHLMLQVTARSLRRLNYAHYTQGNKPGKLLASKLKGKQMQTNIPFLLDANSVKIYNPALITDEFARCYASLYNLGLNNTVPTPALDDIELFLQTANLPSITAPQATGLLAAFTEEEVCKAIKALPKNKAPGPDCFTNLYYQKFASSLVPILTLVFKNIKDTGIIPSEMLQATIVTLPKPGKAPTHCDNFRPISLLNVDAKLYAKLLANRLAPLLPSLIANEQTGFVPGRQTCDNTRRFYDILDLAHRTNSSGLLLALDAEKAFDRLHWGYMRTVLLKFGFPEQFINSIMALYSDPSAKVLATGFLSSAFHITNGTRQGCPLSPLIFILALEPLALQIKTAPAIKGLSTPNGEHKLALFADDILLFLTTPETSLPPLFSLLDHFGAISYYKNNISKTQALPINIAASSLSSLRSKYPFDWRSTSLKYLGISLSKSRGTILRENFTPLLNSIEAQLSKWSTIDSSWLGRMAAMKMCILPQILYYFRNIPVFIPAHLLLRMQKLIHAHIWKGKPPRVSASTVTTPRRNGGLGFLDLQSYYKAALLAQLLSSMYQKEPPLWLQLENAMIFPYRLHDLMWLTFLPRNSTTGLLPVSMLSLMAWRLWGRQLVRPYNLLCLAPLRVLCRFIPDLNLDSWIRRGLTHVWQLFTPHSLKTFPDLVQEFAIPSKECFTYLRVKHALTQKGLPSFINCVWDENVT
uniref:Reverse transcriptase domain-containing protein n=1 Tax=Leptobrachium leishanense TaxID=445787 RepID=A0A8C5MWS0_9ANUR